ncbi:MAG: EAL domain-containing response regulator [Steroidobacteraceae bacterium]|nr:EAL domain-containing response regulator [Steroidobacteraceae bacterium]
MTGTARLRILILDDEPVMLAVLERMLANLGFEDVVAFERGASALEWLRSSGGAVDLVLLDLNMPEMDGVEFLRRLVEIRYEGGVILASGEDETIQQAAVNLVRAHRIVALGHLHKPVQPDALAALIGRWQPGVAPDSRRATRSYSAEDVERAIGNRELVNHYQPKVSVATGALVGVETLVRWLHPGDGLVFPDRFIGVAEEHGHIDALTEVVIGQAIDQARAWRQSGLPLQVSVNVSMENLMTLVFPDRLERLAAGANVPASDLILEVTESRLMSNIVTALDVLTRLRLKRFRLSIDDFGTGHSSLAQLRDIPFDELKVDRGFVHGAVNSEKKRAICEASLSLARQLGIQVVAEGVENAEDWRYLREHGCDLAQGYFIGRPMPGSDLPRWLKTWDARVARGL